MELPTYKAKIGVQLSPGNTITHHIRKWNRNVRPNAFSLRDGAKYIVVFNYSPNGNGTGLLQNEHFSTLQRFWNDTVQNKTVSNGGIKAEAVLVLPKNYGWGMRSLQDNIWGMWHSDDRSSQVWSSLQTCILKYGSKLDIIYDDSAYQVAGDISMSTIGIKPFRKRISYLFAILQDDCKKLFSCLLWCLSHVVRIYCVIQSLAISAAP